MLVKKEKEEECMIISKNAIIAFFISIIFFSLMIGITNYNIHNIEVMNIEHLIMERSSKITDTISKLLYKTEALSSLVIQNDGNIINFDKVATNVMDDPAILNVVMAPDGVVSNVYPLEGNESLIGFDLLDADYPGNREAILAKETQQLVFGGPFELVQGGQALVGRLPIHIAGEDGPKKFWGLVTVTLKYPQALDGASLNLLENQGYAYEIWRDNPDDGQKQIIAQSSIPAVKDGDYVERELSILNANWNFRVYINKQWYHYTENWILILCGVFISILIAYIVKKNDELKTVKMKLERMVDTDLLTQTYNRKGLFRNLEQWIEHEEEFELYYLDLNSFKEINDTYGHKFGDTVLITFCRRFQKHISGEDIFARIGGDEFIFAHKINSEDMSQLWENINQEFTRRIIYKGEEGVCLTFSKGHASFPKHGRNTSELMAYADKKMYKNKNKLKAKAKIKGVT